MTYVIAEPCIGVKDRACVDECPVDCIYEGENQLWIHPEECVDCDACLPACPVDAIFPPTLAPRADFTPLQRVVRETRASGRSRYESRCTAEEPARSSPPPRVTKHLAADLDSLQS